MAEYAYLIAAGAPHQRGTARTLLSAKRNRPFSWDLALAGSSRVEGEDKVLASPTGAAIDRAKRRFARLRPFSGPKLRATFDGFLNYLESVREPFLLFDVTELDGFVDDDLDAALSLDDPAFDPTELDLEEWDVGANDEEGVDDWHFEIYDRGRDATYLMFGSVESGESDWQRPPEEDDADRARAVLAAMLGYVRLTGPTTVDAGIRFTFSHPAHRGAVFRVLMTDDGGYTLSVHRDGQRANDPHDRQQLALAALSDAQRLSAWAAHVATHFALLSFPTDDDWVHGRTVWRTPGGLELGNRMPTYAPDADDLRSHVVDRLRTAIADFVPSQVPWISLDLGPLGSLILEHVTDPAWEPHVRARRILDRGDMTWRTPLPKYLLSPATQIAIIDEVLAQHGAAISSVDGWRLHWPSRNESAALVLHHDRITPERFTAGFLPARAQSLDESAATIVFRGAALLIVMADGVRVAFRFTVPEIAPGAPLFVSGWWVARSGDRFASILRIGARTFRFDNDGKLIAC